MNLGEYIILKIKWARAAQRSNPRPSRSTPEAQRRGQDVNPGEYIILKIKWARAAQRSNPRPSHSTPEAQRRGQDVNRAL
ncbi:MAG: hypothetical protein ACOYKH_09735 [Brevefilum fermentans]